MSENLNFDLNLNMNDDTDYIKSFVEYQRLIKPPTLKDILDLHIKLDLIIEILKDKQNDKS